jgi:hypothetical protein
MPKREPIESLEAKQGEKMIEVKLRFWTNDIAPENGKVLPKLVVEARRASAP